MSTKALTKKDKHWKYAPATVIEALIRCNGVLSQTARHLDVSVSTVKRYMQKYPVIQEHYDEYNQVLVELAKNALKENLVSENPDPALIKFTLERQGKSEGWKKESPQAAKLPNTTINADKVINVSDLTLEEKMVLMKASKKELGLDTEDVNAINMSPFEGDSGIYTFIEEEEPEEQKEEEEDGLE